MMFKFYQINCLKINYLTYLKFRYVIALLCIIFVNTSDAWDVVYDPSVYQKMCQEFVMLSHQLAELSQQTRYLQQALKALDNHQYQWSNAQPLINQLGDTINQTTTLAYSAKELDEHFKKLYPGVTESNEFGKQYENLTATTLNTLNGILQALGTSAQNFQSENTRLTFLQQQSQNAVGQMQAIQAATQMASEQVSQLQLLRQVMMSQANAQTAYYSQQLQKEATQEANLKKVFTSNNTNFQPLESGHKIWEPF